MFTIKHGQPLDVNRLFVHWVLMLVTPDNAALNLHLNLLLHGTAAAAAYGDAYIKRPGGSPTMPAEVTPGLTQLGLLRVELGLNQGWTRVDQG